MFGVPIWSLVAAMIVTAIAALVQGSIGLGFAVLSVPVLSLLDPTLAPVPQLLLSLPLTVYLAWRERHAIDLRGMAWVIVGRFPGAAIGAWLLHVASARMLDAMIGAVVLGGTLISATDAKVRRNAFTELMTGIVSGITGLISAIGGPPVALLYRGDEGAVLRANISAIFTIGLVISIVTRVLAQQVSLHDIWISIALLPSLLIGLAISHHTAKYFEGRALKISVLTICAIAAVGLIGRALFP